MSEPQPRVEDHLAQVRRRILEACRRCNRDPSTVTLIGVSKFKPIEAVIEAARAGLCDFGENYAQELLAKADAAHEAALGIRWHFIGALQSNKARKVAGVATSVQSVDRPSLIATLAAATSPAHPLDVWIEVNLAGEAQKSGAATSDVDALARLVLEAPGLHLAGLMTVPPIVDDPEQSRSFFRALRSLRNDLLAACAPRQGILAGLSMGMSHDFEVAIEEGATMVRVGTAIFGSRT